MKSGEKLLFAAHLLIDLVEESTEKWKRAEGLDNLEYAKEYCTARIAGPRRAGHTWMAIKLATDRFKNPLCIVNSMSMARAWNENHFMPGYRLRAHYLDGDGNVANKEQLAGLPAIDAVIVDCANWISKDRIDQMVTNTIPLFGPNPLMYVLIE